MNTGVGTNKWIIWAICKKDKDEKLELYLFGISIGMRIKGSLDMDYFQMHVNIDI